MRFKNYRLILCMLLTAALLGILLTSCRGGEQIPAEDSTTVNTSTSSAETEPAPPKEPNAEELCEILGRELAVMFAEEATEEVDAEEMLNAMLPYLLGSGEAFTAEDSYHLRRTKSTGDAILLPREIVCLDGVRTVDGEDPIYGDYREIEILHKNGRAYLSTYGGTTSVDGLSPEDNTSPLGELDAEAILLTADQLTEGEEKGMWLLSDIYARKILRGLWGDETVKLLKNDDMECLLDATDYLSKGKLALSLTVTNQTEFTFDIIFSHIGKPTEEMELAMASGEENTFRLYGKTVDGVMTEIEMETLGGGASTLIRQQMSGTHTDFSMQVKSADIVTLSCDLSLDQTSETTCKGTVKASFRASSEKGTGGIMELSATEPIVSEGEGEFAMRQSGGEIGMMEMNLTVRSGTVSTDTTLMLNHDEAAIGESVMYYAIRTTDSAEPKHNSETAMEAKLTARAGDSANYQIGVSYTGDGGTSTASGEVVTPAPAQPTYTTREKELMSRARNVLSFHKSFTKEASVAVETVMEAISRGSVRSLPPTFYLIDTDGDGVVIQVYLTVENNAYYVYADVLLDVENLLYFYDGYDASLQLTAPSGMRQDGERLRNALHIKEGYSCSKAGTPIAYFYQEEMELYVLHDLKTDETGYLHTEPVAADFPGRVLHKVTFDENGEEVGEAHRFVPSYNANCYETLQCADCDTVMVSDLPVHDLVSMQEICALDGRQPHTFLGSCLRCGGVKEVVLEDGKGARMHFTLTRATKEVLMGLTKVSEFSHINKSRDSLTLFLITGISLEGDSFECDVVLPDLRQVTGETILGIGVPDSRTYTLPRGLELTLVLPEGMEFLTGAVLTHELFQYVTKLTMPTTLIYTDALYEVCPIEELTIHAPIKYLGTKLNFPKVKDLTIYCDDLDKLPAIHCHSLERLSIVGTVREFGGFGSTCPLEEVRLPNGVETIGIGAFAYQRNLKKVILPETVKMICTRAFDNCISLEEINFPAGLTVIDKYAFRDCDSLTELTIPEGVLYINEGVFASMDSLKKVTLLGEVVYIYMNAFRDCKVLEEVRCDSAALNYMPPAVVFPGCDMIKIIPKNFQS